MAGVRGLVCLLLAVSPLWSCGERQANGDDGSVDTGQQFVADAADTTTVSPSHLKMAQRVEPSRLMEVVTALAADDMAGRNNGTAGGKKARQYLEQKLSAAGLEPLSKGTWQQPFEQGVNLLARIPGSDPSLADEVVIVGAHYDHLGSVGDGQGQCKPIQLAGHVGDTICNGAIDNAAGVAVALEIGRVLASAENRPKRSVLIALFDAEEEGMLGSKHYADTDPVVALANTVAMFSVDNVGSQLLTGDPTSFALDMEYSKRLRGHVLAANEALGFQTWPVSSFFDGNGKRSDHYPFRLHQVPTIFFGSGSNAVYHTPADEPDEVDQTKLLNTARHALLVTLRVADTVERPDFIADPKAQIEDAHALLHFAERILEKPSVAGLNQDDPLLKVVVSWQKKLSAYIAQPPQDEAGWAEYQSFVRGIITAVLTFL